MTSLLLAIFIDFVILFVGFSIFSKKRNDRVGKLFFLLSIVLVAWLSFNFLEMWVSSDLLAELFFKLDFGIAPFLTWSVFLFLANFSQKSRTTKSLRGIFVCALPAVLAFAFSISGWVVKDFNRVGGYVGFNEGPMFLFYALVIATYILGGLGLLLVQYRKSIGTKKAQIRPVFVGFAITFVFLSGINLFFQRTISVEIFQLSNYSSIFLIFFTGYAMAKYQLFGVKLLTTQLFIIVIWFLALFNFLDNERFFSYFIDSLAFAFSILVGFLLINSVKEEVERKEELQLMADKLAQANDQLRKLDNAKTEFISIASHQLRTPVTVIKGFASLVLEGSFGELSAGVHGAIERMYASSERLVNLIEDLLNVSRIESGRMAFVFEKASMEKLIKELYDNFLLIAKAKKFYLDMELPEVALPEIIMDYSKIRELMSNFIDNALKYTEKGGATVKAEIKESGVVIDENGFVIADQISEFGKILRITVSDTGIGIPKEEIPYLFKKFSRGKDVSRLHVGGTGLGLYVGKAIAEAHHGQVWVESDGAGLGSRFIIEIPVEHVS